MVLCLPCQIHRHSLGKPRIKFNLLDQLYRHLPYEMPAFLPEQFPALTCTVWV